MTLDDAFVRIVPFPVGVGPTHGMIMPNDDGTYSIYLDARTTWERQRVAYEHEIEHIKNNDFYNGKPIREVEDI